MKLEDHPTVQRTRLKTVPSVPPKKESLDAGLLKQLVLDAGADDVGFVEIGRPALDDQREDIFKAFPHTKTLISFVVRMNREAIRTPARSVSNLEFHHSGDEVNEIARSVVQTLEGRGIRAMNPAMGFPMEMDQFPGKVWVVSHKPVAVAAGLGMMGIHRNVIHDGAERVSGDHPERVSGTHPLLEDGRSGQERQIGFMPTSGPSWISSTRESGSSRHSSRKCGSGG
jgi:hypothetical protein